jgi:hypothetical protein
MRRHPLLALVAAAVVAGVVVAAVLALVLPAADGADGGSLSDPRHPRVGSPVVQRRGPGLVTLREVSSPRVEARAADPMGGPDWVVRTFFAREYATRPSGHGEQPISKRNRCAQLGRERDGQFGWIDGTNTWRAVPPSYQGSPVVCGATKKRPVLQTTTRITDPSGGSARPLDAVVWGMAGSSASVDVTVNGAATKAPPSPHGVVLAAIPEAEAQQPALVRARFAYPDGSGATVVLGPRASLMAHRDAALLPGRTGAAVVPLLTNDERPRLDYRMADPNGGLPWGIVAWRTTSGGWCSSDVARIVGERVGQVDPFLDTFSDVEPSFNCERSPLQVPMPTPARPITYGYWYSALPDGSFAFAMRPSPASVRARIVRRTQRGITTISGVAAANVVSLTIETPRDVRTITPSKLSHAFATVYDGNFTTGGIHITARLRDGRVYDAQRQAFDF